MEMREYWKLKEVAIHCALWSTRFGRAYGPIVTQTEELMHAEVFRISRIFGFRIN
jgi:hypothetical protein